MHVARQNPPHLKAIFPYDPRGAYGTLGGFREEYPGGVVHLFRYVVALQNGGISRLRDFNADKAVAGRISWDPARWLSLSGSAIQA